MTKKELKKRLDWIMEGEMARGVWYAKNMQREIDNFFAVHEEQERRLNAYIEKYGRLDEV